MKTLQAMFEYTGKSDVVNGVVICAMVVHATNFFAKNEIGIGVFLLLAAVFVVARAARKSLAAKA